MNENRVSPTPLGNYTDDRSISGISVVTPLWHSGMDPVFILYVTGAEYGSGKSVVVLAIMDILAGLSERIGLFRPVIKTAPDDDALLHLVTTRYGLGHP